MSSSIAPLILVLICLAPRPAVAFEKIEHRWISNRALCVVAEWVKREYEDPSGREKVASDVLESIRNEDAITEAGMDLDQGAALVDYGLLAAYADFVTFPNEVVDTAQSDRRRIASHHVEKITDDFFAGATEMLRNPHHFRLLGLSQFHIWHDAAIARAIEAEARADGSFDPDPLWDALAYNAYADHFLEDFFAPGHMTQESKGLSHMGNLRRHDTDNWAGRLFRFEPKAIKSFRGILGEDSGKEGTAVIDVCFRSDGDRSRGRLKEALKLLDGSVVRLRMFGDNQLYREGANPKTRQSSQVLLLTLAVAQSILDVIEAYIQSDGNARVDRNSFGDRQCLGERKDGRGPPPEAKEENERVECFFVADEADADIRFFAGLSLGRYESSPEDRAPPLFWPTFGTSIELVRIENTSRLQVSPEFIFDLPSECFYGFLDSWTDPGHFSLELGLGYSYVGKGLVGSNYEYSGHGPDLRLYFRAKHIYMFAAAEIGYRWYHGRGNDPSNVRLGGRIGFGNGIFSAYATLSRDQRVTSSGGSMDWATWGFGVSLTVPTTRPFSIVTGR